MRGTLKQVACLEFIDNSPHAEGMENAVNRNASHQNARFVNEAEAARLSGLSIRTLQQDRYHGRYRFPWYKVGARVLYDPAEIEAIIRSTVRGSAGTQEDGAAA